MFFFCDYKGEIKFIRMTLSEQPSSSHRLHADGAIPRRRPNIPRVTVTIAPTWSQRRVTAAPRGVWRGMRPVQSSRHSARAQRHDAPRQFISGNLTPLLRIGRSPGLFSRGKGGLPIPGYEVVLHWALAVGALLCVDEPSGGARGDVSLFLLWGWPKQLYFNATLNSVAPLPRDCGISRIAARILATVRFPAA